MVEGFKMKTLYVWATFNREDLPFPKDIEAVSFFNTLEKAQKTFKNIQAYKKVKIEVQE